MYLRLAVPGLCCCVLAFSSCSSLGSSPDVVPSLRVVVASPAAGHRPRHLGLAAPQHAASSPSRGRSCPLHREAASQARGRQRSCYSCYSVASNGPCLLFSSKTFLWELLGPPLQSAVKCLGVYTLPGSQRSLAND